MTAFVWLMWRMACLFAGCCHHLVSIEWGTADLHCLSRRFTQYNPWCTSMSSQQNVSVCYIRCRTRKVCQDESMYMLNSIHIKVHENRCVCVCFLLYF